MALSSSTFHNDNYSRVTRRCNFFFKELTFAVDFSSSNDDIVWTCLCEDRDSSKHLSISGVCLRISELHYFIDLTLKYPPASLTLCKWQLQTLQCALYLLHINKNTQIHKTQITSPSTCCFTLCKWKFQILQLCIISQSNLDIQTTENWISP